MAKTINIGALSLTGKGAEELVTEAFSGDDYPVTVILKNRLPFAVSYSEIRTRLEIEGGEIGADTALVTFKDAATLTRLAKTAQTLADLYKCRTGLIVESAADDETDEAEPPAEETEAEETETTAAAAKKRGRKAN